MRELEIGDAVSFNPESNNFIYLVSNITRLGDGIWICDSLSGRELGSWSRRCFTLEYDGKNGKQKKGKRINYEF